MTALGLPLPVDEVHLWQVSVDEVPPALFARYEALLTPQEEQRYRRYAFQTGRTQYLLTRALVRSVLSAYFPPVAPEAWRFGAGEHGRPFLTGPQSLDGVSFNLSNTSQQVVCLLARGCEVGVDVERMRGDRDLLGLSKRFFSVEEAEDVRAQPPSNLVRRFYDYWTLKEAYLKARGTGLATPLGQFGFTLAPSGTIRVQFDPRLKDTPEHWQFFQTRASPDQLIGGAVQRGDAPDLRVVHQKAIPLEGLLRPKQPGSR